ncbi:MAG: zinc-dependent metalloprotease [Deltaproteobacteria bacterium]
MNRTQISFITAAVVLAACVDHRPIRNGLMDENLYLTKADLTAHNPKMGEDVHDYGWLFKSTIVSASSPNVVGDYTFPGFESDMRYVKFRFVENALQVVDGQKLQSDDAGDPNDDLATSNERVMFEFNGRHVDIKLRESLDGERTNFLEENTEEPWQMRQNFAVDFERTNMDPITNIAWFYGDFLSDCARTISTHMVPDSFEWDPDDQYMSFVIEVTYDLNVLTWFGGCYDLVSLASDVGTASVRYRLSFFRPGPSPDFPMEEIAEKAPVNKKYGAFKRFNVFRDEETGLLSAKALLHRWNPNRTDPVVFYFIEGFPERFKPMFQEIKADTNRILEEAGASLRFDFQEWNAPGPDGEPMERHFGDARFSFVAWHQDIDTTKGLLGYGPSSSDPRTGEIISANLNLYNVGMDYYRFLIQDYLETNGAAGKPADLEWEQVDCEADQTAVPADNSGRLQTQIFREMRRTMELAEPDLENGQPTDGFLPEPAREEFLNDYHRTLGEIRYAEPAWNPYVYLPKGRSPVENLTDRLATERDFNEAMTNIMLNEDPFQGLALHSRDGIEAQLGFMDDFREWRKNHDRLQADQEYLHSKKNIYVFDANDAISAIATGARRCVNGKFESDEVYSERIIEDVVFNVAIHELGHNLSLRHNFYGSVDKKHMRDDELSASVMDYVVSYEEAGTGRSWGQYDEAALKWIYGTNEVREQMMEEDFLYCTDEHRMRSPLCQAHDLGVTPSQIVLNAIERYDWLYSIRNRRAYRTFWDTNRYIYSVYNSVFPLLRMWYLALFDWGGGGVQGTLKKLDQVNGDPVLTDPEYDEISMDFYNDIQAAIGMTMAFYDAVINQSAAYRNYQTEFDPFYGDILRIGIIVDKLFTTFAFMDLQAVYNYNPDVFTYVSMYDAPFGTRNAALSQRVLDNMLGASYDTFPWFRYYAIGLFSSVTNSNLVGSVELKERIAIRRFETLEELQAEYGDDIVDRATGPDNTQQIFVHDGEEYTYTYLADQGWHLTAGKSRSPVSFQYIRDYNDDLNAGASETLDNFGLKILLAYYEYFNNFVGF